MYKYIFGPVPSRRLGMSLGVNLVPKKVCSLDCVYCEVGKTTKLRMTFLSKQDPCLRLSRHLGVIFYLRILRNLKSNCSESMNVTADRWEKRLL